MIKFVHGNMFTVDVDVRINTVNCVGAMGAGVALTFKKKYPDLYKEYRVECRKGNVVPGKMYIWNSHDGRCVINFPTKNDWRKPSEYKYVEAGLIDLRKYLLGKGQIRIAMPSLGCGNGGLNWERVRRMIEEHLSGLDATIFVFEPARRQGR